MELKDGSLMAVSNDAYRLSKDSGETWSRSRPMPIKVDLGVPPEGFRGTGGIIRLRSGTLCFYYWKRDVVVTQ